MMTEEGRLTVSDFEEVQNSEVLSELSEKPCRSPTLRSGRPTIIGFRGLLPLTSSAATCSTSSTTWCAMNCTS